MNTLEMKAALMNSVEKSKVHPHLDEAFKKLDELIDRETPMKPKITKINDNDYTNAEKCNLLFSLYCQCAKCGNTIYLFENYCSKCGQKIDWSEEK